MIVQKGFFFISPGCEKYMHLFIKSVTSGITSVYPDNLEITFHRILDKLESIQKCPKENKTMKTGVCISVYGGRIWVSDDNESEQISREPDMFEYNKLCIIVMKVLNINKPLVHNFYHVKLGFQILDCIKRDKE
jgi:hypothetical protein